jgi:predicted nucleotidyltransferase
MHSTPGVGPVAQVGLDPARGHEVVDEDQGVAAAGCRVLPDSPMGRRLDGPAHAAPTAAAARRSRLAIIDAAGRRGATNVRVFGSVARGDDTGSSDVDLLVDLRGDVGLLGLIGLERELAEIVGRDVDVVPAANLKDSLASQVLAAAIRL